MTPIHFDELKSHLQHNDNQELNKVFEDIEKREPAHNKEVSEFMSTIEDKIKNSITSNGDMLSEDCNLNHIIFYDSGPETRMPNCILRHVVFYFRDKAQKDLDLEIRRLEEESNNVFQLHTAPDMTEIGRGDQDSMRCLKNKIKLLESSLVDEIKAMIKERDELVKLFDNDFKQKIKTMMAKADNGYIPGECSVELNL